MRTASVVVVLVVASAAWAERKTVIVAGGDCADLALISGAKDFRDTASKLLGPQLLEPEGVLDIVRPRPTRSLQDIERQVESAKALFYGGQGERALELVERALVELERAPPDARPWPVTQAALVLQALVHKNLEHPKEMNEAFRRIVRLDPTFKLDPDAHPPSAIAALDAVKKELSRSRKGTLMVRVEAGPAATVFVDGLALGATPLKVDLPPGTYRVSLTAPGMLSFPHRVELPRDTKLSVDLAFEGGLGLQAPLCLAGDNDGGAIKLAQLVAAERVIILRNTARRAGPPFISGASFDLSSGQQERSAQVAPDRLANLATFLITGKESAGIQVSAPVVEKQPVAVVEKKPAADPVKVAPSPLAPPLIDADLGRGVPTIDATSGMSRGPVGSFVLIGVGPGAILLGSIVYAAGFEDRKRYAGITQTGKLPVSSVMVGREAMTLLQKIEAERGLTFALIGGGIGAIGAGLLGLWLFPASTTSVGISPTPSGASMHVGGVF